MSLLKQHINLRTSVYKQIISATTLAQTNDLLRFINSIPQIPSNLNTKQTTLLPHHLKKYTLKAKLNKIRKPLLKQEFNNALVRFNALRFPSVPTCKRR